MSSFVYHFKAMGEFKLELQSGNAQFGSKSAFFYPVWPWNLTDNPKKIWHLFYILRQALCFVSKTWVNLNWSYSPETLNSGQIQHFFCPMWPWNWMDDLENQEATSSILSQALCIISKPSLNSNWSYSSKTLNLGQNWTFFYPFVTFKFQRWPWKAIGHLFPSFFKLCVSFHSHWWIYTGVTDRKRPIWIKIDNFVSCVTLKFNGWPSKTIGHLVWATSSFAHHFMAICEFKLGLGSGNGWICFWPLWPWPLMSDLDFFHGHHFCHW